ncbi:MAG: hypothetical protein FJ100_22040 [Deltaproteobacteria bacterium]|nr:hypothetical protein [Deltaproteobacteria bacterium]
MNLNTARWVTKNGDPDPLLDPERKVVYADAPNGPERLVFYPRGRMHVVALGQAPLPQPSSVEAIAFQGAAMGTPVLTIRGDASWNLRGPVRLRSGALPCDHPTALCAVSVPGAPAADRKVRFEATHNLRFQVNGPLAVAVRPFAVSIGAGLVPTVPALAANAQFTVDAAGKAYAEVPVVASSTVGADTWSSQPLPQGGPPPPVQTLGFGPGGGPWVGHIVYRTAAGATLHLAP